MSKTRTFILQQYGITYRKGKNMIKDKKKFPENDVKAILKLYGFDTIFSEQREYINHHEEYGWNVKVVLSVLLENGQRVVIKIVNGKGDNMLKEREKTEKQSTFSAFMRQNGIITPKCYMSNGRYCNEYVYNDFLCNVTVEDWCGEEITEINTELSYKIGELMARMHILSLNNNYEIGCETLFSAAHQNDVDAYEDFCKICENECLDKVVIEQIKKHRNEKLAAIRAVWDKLPKAAVQGDISINNLAYGNEVLTVFDYNNAGDVVLVSDLVLEGLLTAYEMNLPKGIDQSVREQFFPALLKGYLSVRQLSEEEADIAWSIYTLYHSLWFSRIKYNEDSLEKLVKNEDYLSANRLLVQMLADITESDDGRFRKCCTKN